MVWTRGGGLPALYQTASQPTGPLLPFLCQGFQWAGAQALHLSCPAWHHNQSGANQSTPTGPQALCMAVPITLTTPLCPHVQVTRVGGCSVCRTSLTRYAIRDRVAKLPLLYTPPWGSADVSAEPRHRKPRPLPNVLPDLPSQL